MGAHRRPTEAYTPAKVSKASLLKAAQPAPHLATHVAERKPHKTISSSSQHLCKGMKQTYLGAQGAHTQGSPSNH